ncbi:UDP-4-amino-4,6-dideoxy-N-acetyl-beta-L-altrosamine transaminase [Aliarcobacter butzleri]|uniref:UDP-4-amino-4, 6-dideoxy-N-acetyl-beta-L-altrosamine transaminase n=1 Tax=Aliarcobacter butzleri TaxID=28197 RepID=UPI001EDB3CA8|nr:UDP-4-amino-4,6-dideoxy-N-acetyl-beta-L-altrosamine transaminase [Aliarcobacter butzleri]MCG3711682.1 UDP-4-amino-4,6-dideoxy-N-acetyl-beta-L-altrosamine transaminase [Aliarcobacter butzleri]MCG3714066.1 UDP-4-amino-4,6-dideoxy-N-acetyl-beta-L-altrosamine transaminase [Aliarcobacter butzleri]
MIDFIPYGKQLIDEEDISAVVEVLKSDFLTTGPKIKEFEDKICEFTGAKYCVAVANGTAALHLASMVLLEKDDKVLTTPNSFLATSNAILYVEAKPIFVDIKEDGNIDLDLCERELQKDKSIKAIYVVHLSGNPVNQEKLKYLKDTYKIKILEDCAHSLGASFGGVKAGNCKNSDCSILSFHPVKHLTTGEGGAITTNDEELYKKLLELRTHGMQRMSEIAPWYYEMHSLGFNYRITDIACALGISQLKKLNSFILKRKEIAKRYDEVFINSIVKPLYLYNENSSYHLYVVRVDFTKLNISKIELFNKMKEKNIGLQLHYIPINKQPFYKNLGFGNEKTPIMDKYYEECFSLPMYPSLTIDEQKYVIKNLLEILND